MSEQALKDIHAERQRQIQVEGWTEEHDDLHINGQLAAAAACYATSCRLFMVMQGAGRAVFNDLWPWSEKWWKPKNRRRDLVRAGALIVAEIERLDRAENGS